eukprot:3940532-Rhodomonas_salina.1
MDANRRQAGVPRIVFIRGLSLCTDTATELGYGGTTLLYHVAFPTRLPAVPSYEKALRPLPGDDMRYCARETAENIGFACNLLTGEPALVLVYRNALYPETLVLVYPGMLVLVYPETLVLVYPEMLVLVYPETLVLVYPETLVLLSPEMLVRVCCYAMSDAMERTYFTAETKAELTDQVYQRSLFTAHLAVHPSPFALITLFSAPVTPFAFSSPVTLCSSPLRPRQRSLLRSVLTLHSFLVTLHSSLLTLHPSPSSLSRRPSPFAFRYLLHDAWCQPTLSARRYTWSRERWPSTAKRSLATGVPRT